MKWTDEQIRELCDKATEGPWEWEKYDEEIAPGAVVASAGWLELPLVYTQQGAAFHLEDVEFIAAARELVPQLLDRAQKAEAELRRCYKDMEELLAERRDLKAMLADAGIRNAVLEKRLNYTTELLAQLGNCPSVEPVQGCINVPCGVCWHEWLEQEVRA